MKNFDRIHPVQKKLIEIIKKNIDEPLTIREMQSILGLSSPSIITHHLKQLEKKGYLKRNPYNSRDYIILTSNPERKITYLNFYGYGQCGPNGSSLSGNPSERIPISTSLLTFPSLEGFMLKAKGNSMEPRIHEGDYVIAKRANYANNGDIIICTNNNKVLIKKYIRREDVILLASLNTNYDPIIPEKEDFAIEGIVKGIISQKFA